LLFISLLIALIACHTLKDEDIGLTRDLVDRVNTIPGNTWTASTQQGSLIEGATVGQIKALLGVKLGGPKLPRKTKFEVEDKDVPDTFDSRTNWPQCLTMTQIRDQSACGTCWAFGAAEAISDRYCTYKVNNNFSISSGDISFCCGFSCGDGCGGGYPSAAWDYWTSSGVVSETCYPYPLPSCDHHLPKSKNPCPSDEYPNPDCPSACADGSDWSTAKHFGSSSYSASGESDIMKEIYANGPVETAFSVYQDFLAYKSGVYIQTSNDFLGGHAVKFLGWGTENGVKYWLVANSWNPNWGNKGYFKIRRGTDECGIEDSINAGIPKN